MNKVLLGPKPLIYPMPVLLIGSNVDGKPDFMAAAWVGIVCGEPPVIAVGIRHQRHTLKGVRQNMVFSVNVPSVDLVKETDYCGIVSGATADKVADCHFEVFYGKTGHAPLITQCPVNLECTVVHILNLGSHALVAGRIEESHVSEDCLTDGNPDVLKIRPFIYTTAPARDYYGFGEAVGKAFEIGKGLKPGK